MLSTKLKEAAGNSADATLYVDDVFSTYLYTGNGSTQTITNGIDLAGKGGLVWCKSRTVANYHYLTDTARGTNSQINTNTTDAAETLTNRVTSFNSTGFSIGSSSVINGNGETQVSWTFRKAAKFFDVVTYTGNGTTQNIAHSLGVAPGMMVIKCVSGGDQSGVGNWPVFHRSLSFGKIINLNLTNAQGNSQTPTYYGDNTNPVDPTSSQFTVGSNVNVNSSGGTYVAYLFAHDTSSTGIIQCGSFTTDGSGNATVNLGWEPQYLMVKGTYAGSNWLIADSMRGMPVYSGKTSILFPNTSTAESTTINFFSPTATGFTSTGVFGAGETYIYMAIRMPNKPPTTGTQVYNANITNGIQVPAFVSGFPVDFAIRSNIAADQKITATRLLGATAMNTVSTSVEGSEPPNKFDYMNGFYSTTFASNTIAWMFKRAPGFFDEVCYTGTGSATTQAHNLTVVPEMMIVKERSAANNWWVYVSSVGNTKYSVLNSTAAPVTSSTAWNNTTPTASVFSIGTGANVNASTQTFVAYLFATLAGISKVGSYTGNGTGQAIACGFSAGARFVLIKRTDSTGDWYTFDSARGLTSGSSPYLLLNSTAAETTGNNGVYASTGGFTLGSTASTTTNINGASYIYLSVA